MTNPEIQLQIEDGRLVVRLLENDDQGGYVVSEDWISIAEVKAALGINDQG